MMAHHGERSGPLPLATAFQFLPMPAASTNTTDMSADATHANNVHGVSEKKVANVPSPAMNAQAKLYDQSVPVGNLIARNNKRQKSNRTAANRKRTGRAFATRKLIRAPNAIYVENQQFGFFGSW